MTILVTGSIAYDHIMDFPGYFKDHILPEQIHILNVSFLVDTLRKQRGGCATNIAYSLSLLQERSSILGTVGSDFDDYRAFLEELGVDTSLVKVIPDKFTASCFITTDKSGNQITGFYPGAMAHAAELQIADANPHEIEIAIISPDDPAAMIQHVKESQRLKVPYIYDIGWQVIKFSPEELLESIKGAKLIIGNDYELEVFREKTGLTPEQILEEAEYVIITKGEKGSTIMSRERSVDIPVVPIEVLRDPTGAGDSYRSGIAKGLIRGYSLEQMGRVAALVAAYCVEAYGTQGHSFTPAEFEARYIENFGQPELPLWSEVAVSRG